MDLDTPLRYRPRWETIPVESAPVAIEDRQTEGIDITGLERRIPSVQRELARTGPVEGSRTLRLTVIAVGNHQEVPAGALEDDVTGIIVKLQVPGRGS